MRTIPLTKGVFAVVDDDWFEMLSLVAWQCSDNRKGNQYAVKSLAGNKTDFMHRIIADAKKHELVDHINGNGLDNRRCNLRICSSLQNNANARKTRKKTSSKYKGVTWHSRDCKWQVQANGTQKKIYIGYFDSEKDAALAYNDYAIKTWGEFAKLNIIMHGDGA